MSNFLDVFRIILDILCILIALWFLYTGLKTNKLKQIKPTRYTVRYFVDEDDNKVLPSKALYAVLLNDKKVRLKEKVADTEDSILIHTDGKRYLMYCESGPYTSAVDIIAQLKITKTSIKYFILPLIIFCLQLYNSILNVNPTELERFDKMQNERIEQYDGYIDEAELTTLHLFTRISIKADADTIIDYQKNIMMLDLIMYFDGQIDDFHFEESNNRSYNIYMNKCVDTFKDCLDVLRDVKEGTIDEESADALINKIILPQRIINYTIFAVKAVIDMYTCLLFFVYGLRLVFYLLFKLMFKAEYT